MTNRVKRAGWRRAIWRLWRLQWLPRAEFRRLSAFVTTIVKVRGWVLAAPSLVASQTNRTRNKYRDSRLPTPLTRALGLNRGPDTHNN